MRPNLKTTLPLNDPRVGASHIEDHGTFCIYYKDDPYSYYHFKKSGKLYFYDEELQAKVEENSIHPYHKSIIYEEKA